jgi:hypothetical protein
MPKNKKLNSSHTVEYSSTKHGYPGLNSGIILMDFDRIRKSRLYEESLKAENIKRIIEKYSFRGHLGDQDFYTILGYEFPDLIYHLDCVWNRQLCTWWKNHGYSDIFDNYFHCKDFYLYEDFAYHAIFFQAKETLKSIMEIATPGSHNKSNPSS